MWLDEHVLFADVEERFGDPFAAVAMRYDHRAIRDWLRRLEAAPVAAPDLLQELLYGLDALIRVHLWKENEIYLRMLDDAAWPAA